jgi:hypothetical protein
MNASKFVLPTTLAAAVVLFAFKMAGAGALPIGLDAPTAAATPYSADHARIVDAAMNREPAPTF